LNSKAVADYSLKLENQGIYTFAKADLSHQFSEKCVRALEQTMRDGDKIEWFSVVLEAVVVDSLKLDMHWRTDASVEARIAVKNEARQTLAGILENSDPHKSGHDVEVGLETDSDKATVIAAKGLVLVGYRARPLQPVYAQ